CTLAQFNAGPQACFMAINFDKAGSSGTEVFAYDYDSVMHYSAFAFAKTAASPTITALQPIPPGQAMGQRAHLSTLDLASMNALSPVLRISHVMFKNTGNQPLVRLAGRDDDIDVRFACRAGTIMTGAALVDTASLPLGTVATTCSANSVLWAERYTYPNS